MTTTSFLTQAELQEMGFGSVGRSVKISRKASFYNPSRIFIGDFTRVDDFCVLSAGEGGIAIGRNVHIAVYSLLIGQAKITIGDFAGLSSRVSIYSSNDDYSGEFMTNPTVDSKYTHVHTAPVVIKEHAIIGSGSVVLPGVTIGEGASIGALTLVNRDCDAFKVYFGTPMRPLMARSRRLLELAEDLLKEERLSQ